jgi:hypothetical protein
MEPRRTSPRLPAGRARHRLLLILLAALAPALSACRPDAPPPPLADGVADEDSPADLVALLADLLPRIERLSGLDRRDVIRMRRQGREDARRYVESRLDTEMPPERMEGVRRSYVAMGLLPDTLDLRALLLDLYTEQVLGYYDPATKTLYVVEGEDAAGLRPLLAHELVHALQDQHASIDSLVAHERGNDRQTAAHAALEGHAMVVMFAVLAEEATRRRVDPVALPDPAAELGDALRQQNQQFAVFSRAPAIIQETLLFPYVHGASFVHQLWSAMAPMERYPAPLDTLMPRSTAHVMAPRQFLAGEREPVELRFDAPATGWSALYENSMGRLETGIFLAVHAGEGARGATEGWMGDRYVLMARDGAPDVLHWVSVWETQAAASRFAAAARGAASSLAGRHVAVTSRSVEGMPAVGITITAGAEAADLPAPGIRQDRGVALVAGTARPAGFAALGASRSAAQ